MPSVSKVLAVVASVLFVSCASAGAAGPSTTSSAGGTTTSTVPPTTITTSTMLATTTTTLPPRQTLVIQGTGDVNLDPTYIPNLADGYDFAWAGVGALLRADDLTIVNLECAPSDLGVAEPKDFVFRCPVAALSSLAAGGVEVANMANNHSGDYGKAALVDGRANLLAAGVAPVGAGADAAEAGEPALFELQGWRVAVLGFGGVYPTTDWFATDDRAGMRNGDDIDSMVDAVTAADQLADIVVVTIHWGVELDTQPRPEDIEIAGALVEAGADVIFGHHSHRLQPLETVDGAAVFWGLGNFVWPRYSDAGSTTGVARAVVHPDGTIESCLIPAFIEVSGQPVLTGPAECGPPVEG